MVVTFICHWDIQPGETQVEPMEGQSDIWLPPSPFRLLHGWQAPQGLQSQSSISWATLPYAEKACILNFSTGKRGPGPLNGT